MFWKCVIQDGSWWANSVTMLMIPPSNIRLNYLRCWWPFLDYDTVSSCSTWIPWRKQLLSCVFVSWGCSALAASPGIYMTPAESKWCLLSFCSAKMECDSHSPICLEHSYKVCLWLKTCRMHLCNHCILCFWHLFWDISCVSSVIMPR